MAAHADVVCIVHGGAGYISDAAAPTAKAGVSAAARAGYAVLVRGGSAVDAVEAAVRVLEDAPFFNAGTGSVLNAAGFVEMDALIVDGATLATGAVAGVRRVKNPVTLARAVMERSPHVLLGGEGADAFAVAQGVPTVAPDALITQARRDGLAAVLAEQAAAASAAAAAAGGCGGRAGGGSSSRGVGAEGTAALPTAPAVASAGAPAPEAGDAGDHDTVGAVAIDRRGNIAAATSTGGLTGKLLGRIGDSPLMGAGGYADNTAGGVSTTGTGEFIIRSLLAKSVCDAWEASSGGGQPGVSRAAAAVAAGLTRMHRKVGSEGAGVIFIAPGGDVGVGHSSERMSWAVCRGSTEHTYAFDCDVAIPPLPPAPGLPPLTSIDTGAAVDLHVLPGGPRFRAVER